MRSITCDFVCSTWFGSDRFGSLTFFNFVCRGVRSQIGPFAAPDVIHHAPGLPKSRSGKIMRRILRKVASGQTDELGDTSTLADPSIVATLISLRPEMKQ